MKSDFNPIILKENEKIASLNENIKYELACLDTMDWNKIPLQIIKSSKLPPCIGDVFVVNPFSEIYYPGIVVNANIIIDGEDSYYTIFVFDKKLCLDDIEPELLNKSLNSCSILTGPLIVERWYWKKGYFLNVSHMDCFIKENDYGYYRNGNHMFCDDYGHEISYIPQKLATYGVQTRYGVSYNIRKKLIMNGLKEAFVSKIGQN